MWTRTWLTSSATESRCNKYFSPIPYDPWNQSTAPGKREKIEKEREREREEKPGFRGIEPGSKCYVK